MAQLQAIMELVCLRYTNTFEEFFSKQVTYTIGLIFQSRMLVWQVVFPSPLLRLFAIFCEVVGMFHSPSWNNNEPSYSVKTDSIGLPSWAFPQTPPPPAFPQTPPPPGIPPDPPPPGIPPDPPRHSPGLPPPGYSPGPPPPGYSPRTLPPEDNCLPWYSCRGLVVSVVDYDPLTSVWLC